MAILAQSDDWGVVCKSVTIRRALELDRSIKR